MFEKREKEATHGETLKMYVSPKLIEYGSVAKLTQGGSGTGDDGGEPGHRKMCL